MGIGLNHGPMTDLRHAQQAAINELTSLVLAERAPMSNLGGCGNSALQTVVTHSNPQKDRIWLFNIAENEPFVVDLPIYLSIYIYIYLCVCVYLLNLVFFPSYIKFP